MADTLANGFGLPSDGGFDNDHLGTLMRFKPPPTSSPRSLGTGQARCMWLGAVGQAYRLTSERVPAGAIPDARNAPAGISENSPNPEACATALSEISEYMRTMGGSIFAQFHE